MVKAHELGCKFDGWREKFDYQKWEKAFSETGIDPQFYANRRRDYEEIHPWSHIDVGVTDKFLIRENEKAKAGELTTDCRNQCVSCGINTQYLCFTKDNKSKAGNAHE